MKPWLPLCAALLACAPALALEASVPQTFRLRNGMRLVVKEDHSTPFVGMALAVDAGAAFEEGGKAATTAGASSLLAGLWKEIDMVPKHKGLVAKLEAGGGFWSTEAGPVTVRGGMEVLGEELPAALDLAAAWLALREPDEAAFAAAREQLLRTVATRRDYPRDSGALEAMARELAFGTHPLGRSELGGEQGAAKLTREALRDFAARVVSPSRAALVLVGDVDPDKALALVLERFQGEGQPFDPLQGLPPAPEAPALRDKVVYAAVDTGMARVGFLVPGVRDRDWYACYLLKEILGRGHGSRLGRRLLHEEGSVKDMDADLTAFPGANLLSFELVATGDDPAGPAKAVLEECARIARSGVTAEVLERRRNAAKALRALDRQTRYAQAAYLAQATLVDDLDFELDFNTRLDEVGAEDLRRVAARWLAPERAVYAAVLPRAAEKAEVRALVTKKVGDLTVVVKRDQASDVVGISILLPGSMANEPVDQPGLAGLLEAFLAHGSGTRESHEESEERLERAGAKVRPVGTGVDGVVVSVNATVFTFEELLAVLFDQVMAPRFEAENLRLVQSFVGDAWTDFAQNPEEKGFWHMVQHLFAEGPYGLSAEVLAKRPGGYDLERLRAFHSALLRERRAVLTVAGNVAPEKVFAAVERLAAGYPPPGEGPGAPDRTPAYVTPAGIETETRPGTKPFDAVWLGVKLPAESRGDLPALTVWFNLLALQSQAILPAVVRGVDPGAELISRSMQVMGHGGAMALGWKVGRGKGAAAAAALEKAWAKVPGTAIDPALVEPTRKRILTFLASAAQDKVVQSASLAAAAGVYRDAALEDQLLKAYGKIDAAELARVAKKYFGHARLLVYAGSTK